MEKIQKTNKMWEIKQAANPNELNLYIYGDVEGDYYDGWNGREVESETSAESFKKELAKYSDVRQINLYINSYGGSVFEGTAIYNQLKRHNAHITAYVDGFACSVAATIAMAADTVVMPKNTMMMIHNAWMQASGNADELRKAADDLDQINRGNRQAYLQKAGEKLDEETLITLLDNETWLTAEDCIKYGFADEYAEKEADLSLAEEILQKANLNLQQRIKVQQSLVAQFKQIAKEQNEPAIAQHLVEEPKIEEPKQHKLFKFGG